MRFLAPHTPAPGLKKLTGCTGMGIKTFNRLLWLLALGLSLVLYAVSVMWFTYIREYALEDFTVDQCSIDGDTGY